MVSDDKRMKTALELAMERFQAPGEGAAAPLSDEQKRELAEIDREAAAKIAEQEILLKSRIGAALAGGNAEEVVKLREQLATELRRIRERAEAKKDEVRTRGGG